MSFRAFFPLVFLLWTLVPQVLAAETGGATAQTRFEAGVAAFRKGDTKQARQEFQEALKQDGNNPAVLNNLALGMQKDGQLGLALALWRKALAARPDFQPALRAIRWTQSRLEQKAISHEVEFSEYLRDTALVGVSLERYLFLTALGLFTASWLLLKYFGLRRHAFLDEKPLPPFPWLASGCTVFFALSAVLTVAKVLDDSVLRGTIVTRKIEARSSPDPSATSLFDLYEGLEVIVKQTSGDWTQVTYPGGSTGWIPKTAVFATSDPVAEKLEKGTSP